MTPLVCSVDTSSPILNLRSIHYIAFFSTWNDDTRYSRVLRATGWQWATVHSKTSPSFGEVNCLESEMKKATVTSRRAVCSVSPHSPPGRYRSHTQIPRSVFLLMIFFFSFDPEKIFCLEFRQKVWSLSQDPLVQCGCCYRPQ